MIFDKSAHDDDHTHDDHRTSGEDAALDAALRRVALQLVSSDEAEDLVQETWLALLLAGTASIRHRASWMKGVVRNLAARSLGAAHRRQDIEEQAAIEDVMESHVGAFERTSVIELLRSTLATLREPYHTVLRKRFLLEKSLDEIAREHECSRETVKSQLRRGLSEMRDTLDRRTGGDRATWVGGLVVVFDLSIHESTLRTHENASRTSAGAGVAQPSIAVRASVLVACVLLPVLGILWFQGREQPESVPSLVQSAATEDLQSLAGVVADRIAQEPQEDSAAPAPDAVPATETVKESERELLVHLLTREGQPAPFGHVDVIGAEQVVVARLRTDVQGRARVLLEAGELLFPPAIPHAEGGVVISAREEHGAWSASYRLPLPGDGASFTITGSGPGQALAGIVNDPFGDPVADALVHLRREVTGTKRTPEGVAYSERGFSVRTDSDGRFRFEGLPRRLHHLSVQTTSWLSTERAVEGDVECLEVPFELEEGAVLVGQLVDAGGRPAVGVRVWDEPFRNTREVETPETMTDTQGEFVLTGLSGGTHRIFARNGEGRFASALVEIDRELGGEWEGTLEHVDPLRVRVVDADGHPISKASVVAIAASTPPWGDMVVSDEQGWAVWTHVPDEPIALSARRSLADRTHGPELRGVRRGQEGLELRFEAKPVGGVVRGILLDRNGRPFERAVIIGCSRADMFQTQADPESGAFRSDVRDPGSYEVWAAVEGHGVLSLGGGELRSEAELDLQIVHAPTPVQVLVTNAQRSSCVIEVEGQCNLEPKPIDHFEGASQELWLFPGDYRLTVLSRHADPLHFQVLEGEQTIELNTQRSGD